MKSLEKGNITIRGKVVSRSTAPTRKVSPFKSPKNSDFSLVISNTYSKMLKLTSTKKGSLAPFWGLKYKNAKLKTERVLLSESQTEMNTETNTVFRWRLRDQARKKISSVRSRKKTKSEDFFLSFSKEYISNE